jgi:hypothetical protein
MPHIARWSNVITEFYLDSNAVAALESIYSDRAVAALGYMLQQCKNLHTLRLRSWNFTDDNVRMSFGSRCHGDKWRVGYNTFKENLVKCQSLVQLQIISCRVTADSTEMENMIMSLMNLKKLDTTKTPVRMMLFVKRFSIYGLCERGLTSFKHSYCNDESNVKNFVCAVLTLPFSVSLQSLALTQSGFKSDIGQFAPLFAACSSLTSLTLDTNPCMGWPGISAITNAVAPIIKSLSFTYCCTSIPEDANYEFDCFFRCTSLTALYLDQNNVGVFSGQILRSFPRSLVTLGAYGETFRNVDEVIVMLSSLPKLRRCDFATYAFVFDNNIIMQNWEMRQDAIEDLRERFEVFRTPLDEDNLPHSLVCQVCLGSIDSTKVSRFSPGCCCSHAARQAN